MTLSGNDIANVNGSGALARCSGSFVILKASEGLRFKDFYHDGWAAQARARGMLVGHYHYAHLQNSPTAEADFFVACASPKAGEVMALDFEPYGQPVSDSAYPAWIVAFLDRVSSLVNGPCWIYLNDDMASRVVRRATAAQMARIRLAPLWKARYSSSPGSLFGWSSFTAWQYGGTGLDADYAYLTAAQWISLGAGGHSTSTTIPGATPASAHPTTTEPTSTKGTPRMFIAVHPKRGVWLLAPGYAHQLNSAENKAFKPLMNTVYPIRSFDPSNVGLAEFDLVHAVMTHASPLY